MIGFLQGRVLFSNGQETILLSDSGIGHQIKTCEIFPEGQIIGLYISHIVKENSQELFGFFMMREKKLFELLLNVKGVGPKGAYRLVHSLGFQGVVDAISNQDKRSLKKTPGIGTKVAAQVLLDLEDKIKKVAMYSNQYSGEVPSVTKKPHDSSYREKSALMTTISPSFTIQKNLLDDALLACEQLGFLPNMVIPIAQKLLNEHDIAKPEQLVHLILKDM